MKRIISIILILCMVFTSCSKPKPVDVEEPEKNIIPPGEKYELEALSSDKQGIEKNTVFQLTSKEEIKDNYIKDNLQIVPGQEYKVEKLSATVLNIIPTGDLENDKVYQIKLNDENYEYSWAFQTKKKFEIESTIPANESSFVPANSGIEIYFTLSNIEKMDDFF